MMEKTKQRMIIVFPVLLCLIGIMLSSAFWLLEFQKSAFEHVSQFCEIILEEQPEAQTKVLSALKKYASLTEEEIRGNHFLDQYGYRNHSFCKNLPWNSLLCSFALFLVTGLGFLFSVRYADKRNQRRIAELTSYLEQVNTGAVGTVIQTKEDEFSHLQDEMYKVVTSLYQTREEAVHAKINFADNLANIAHQLKTPITAAFLSLQLMKRETPDIYEDSAEKQLERLSHLGEALLTLSRIDAGTLLLERSGVDIYTALCLAADQLSGLLEKEGISVSIPEKGCREITGDLEWTMEALINLLKNCMEHSPRGGCIHCDYSHNPIYTEILIWDEGEGFCPEDIPHLFERFYRGKGAAGNGIGIGLSLARSIFELQNGSLSAYNLPKGGACFEIRIYSH